MNINDKIRESLKKKPKVCCCGHDKDAHKVKPQSKYTSIKRCNDCACNRFMDRTRPNKTDLLAAITLPIMFGFVTFVLITPFGIIYMNTPEDDPWWQETIEFTMEQLAAVSLVAIIILLAVLSGVFLSPITDYFEYKKRKRY